MDTSRDIKPISYLKTHASELVQDVSENRRTVVITKNGEAKAVVIGVEQYEEWKKALALLKILAQSEQDFRAGHSIPQDEVFERLEAIIDEQEAVTKKAV